MKRALFAAVLLFTPFIADAQEPATPPIEAPAAAETPKADEAKPDKVEPAMTGDQANELVDKDVETTDALNDAAEIVKASKDLANAEDGNVDIKVLITLLLAAIFKFLLSAIKLSGRFSDKLKEFWASDKGKLVLRLSTLVLGAAVMLTANIAAGVPWLEALFMGLGAGPGSLAIHESVKIIPMFAKKSAPADEAKG